METVKLNMQSLLTGSFEEEPIDAQTKLTEKIRSLGGSKEIKDIANYVYLVIKRLKMKDQYAIDEMILHSKKDVLDIIAKIYDYLNTVYEIDYEFIQNRSVWFGKYMFNKNGSNETFAAFFFYTAFIYIGNLEWHWPEKCFSVGNKLCGRNIYFTFDKTKNKWTWKYGYKFED